MDHRTKPGTPGEVLEHSGVKGMRWGVRKAESTGGDKPKKSLGKKVAIGAGVVTLAAGAGFVAYTLKKSGAIPVSSLPTADAARVKSFLDAGGHGGNKEAAKYAEMFLKNAGR